MRSFLLKKLDLTTDSDTLFNRLKDLPGSILLDSGMLVGGLSRYSFMAADPFLVVTSRGNEVKVEKRAGPGSGATEIVAGNPLDVLGGLMKLYRMEGVSGPAPFFGGAAGFFSYDLGRLLEKVPDLASYDVCTPDCWLGFYDVVAAVDHVEGGVYITSTGLPEEDAEKSTLRARERLEWLEETILNGCGEKPVAGGEEPGEDWDGEGAAGMFSDFDRDSYCRVVERAREYIAAGDIFQVNLSQRFRLPRRGDPWEIFRRVKRINPAPMAAYINCGDLRVVSASPERFLKVTSGMVETRPIKGTRPRGKCPEEDRRMREALWNSEKDRAELVMIVDLERNDLGRVCVPGSVTVPELYRIEEYPTVFHLVSTVTGRLEEGKGVVDLLKASFPGGSITGAPKIRAMEIIEELEPVRRGIYCGSIGYLCFNGDADLNIVIRTLVFTGENIHLQVGGGITIDSDPHAEYVETLDKAGALVRALRLEGVLD
ncbi:MAG: aminodeoxychorismate synthase component I [Firmicutes bacterium]|nr:aminodeoxychorismate synthase component I [Bacillota bacterium]MCL5057490.1 aminodeoxychorismate synthase component I [Actinomycetota bacterium]